LTGGRSGLLTALFSSFDRHGAGRALLDSDQQLSYAEFNRIVALFAGQLLRQGIRVESRVGLFLENSVRYLVAYVALIRIGAVVVPVDFQATERVQGEIFADCDPAALIVSPLTQRRCTFPGPQICLDRIQTTNEPEWSTPWPGDEALASILYTTGSTDRAKGVMLTHRNVAASLENILSVIPYRQTTRELIALPLTHSFGLNQALVNLVSGGTVVFVNGFGRVGSILKLFQTEQIGSFPCTPTSLRLLIDTNRFDRVTGSLNRLIVNSSPLPVELSRVIFSKFPAVQLFVYYGLTEASRATFHQLKAEMTDLELTSVGYPSRHTHIAFLPEEGIDAVGDEGELLISGEAVCSGYWNDSTRAKRDAPGGWFRTGDLGHRDSAGRLFITGRLKDQINVGGQKVSGAEIGRLAESFPGVREAAALGRADSILGEVPILAIVQEREIDRQQLIDFLVARLESYKVPRDVVVVDRLPRSETGKLLRRELEGLIGKG